MMLINNWFEEKRGLATSIAVSGISGGGALLSPLVNRLIKNVGWRTSYRVYALIILALAVIFGFFLIYLKPEDRGMKPYGHKEGDDSIELLNKFIDENNKDESKAKLSLDLVQVLDAVESKKDSKLIEALKASAPNKNVCVRPLIGTCELSRYIHIKDDIDLVVYGPGLIKMAHKVDEYIELDEYYDTIEIFKKTALKYLND